jgi:heme a synthase
MPDVRPSAAVSVGVRRVFIANLIVQSGIVVTGAIVRVTASGLGCPTWPECTAGSLVPTDDQAESWHKFIEFGNRLLTFVLAILAIAAVVAILRQRRRWRAAGFATRPALLALAFVPLIGTIGQAILGGITVLTGLHPATVSAHFLVSMAIIAACVALVARSGDVGDQPLTFLVPRPIRWLAWALVSAAAVVVFLGVLVTGTGPHSGDVGVDSRLPFDFRTISWLHADAVFLFIGLLIGLLTALAVQRSAPSALKRATLLTAIAGVQAAIGYAQFFSGLPELLVIVHVLGAVVVWVTVLFIPPALRQRGNVREVTQGMDRLPRPETTVPNT